MEGLIYNCSWKKEKGKYTIWDIDNTNLNTSSSIFEDALDSMREKILCEYGDGEAQINFDKSLPKNLFPVKYSYPEIYRIAGNDGVDNVETFQPDIYTKDYCMHCNIGLGERTKKQLILPSLPRTSNGAILSGYNNIFSEDFLELFTSDELDNINFLEVKSIKKSKRIFYELIGPSITDYIGVKSFQGKKIYICPSCGKIGFLYTYKSNFYWFISRAMLPDKIPNLFVIGRYNLGLCIIGKRWREIQSKKGAKGIVAEQIGIVKENDEIVLREDMNKE